MFSDTSEITSLCSLSASQGADDFYYMQQMSGERYFDCIVQSYINVENLHKKSIYRTKEVSIVSASQSSQGDLPATEQLPPKKEPGTTKNVSFKNHTDSSPSSTYKPHTEILSSRSFGDSVPNNRSQVEANNTFKGHAEVLSSNGARPVLEKDQLAKSPYGWRPEVMCLLNMFL